VVALRTPPVSSTRVGQKVDTEFTMRIIGEAIGATRVVFQPGKITTALRDAALVRLISPIPCLTH
jgi:hypothetical protein